MSSVDTDLIKQKCTYVKVTSLEQLSLAEFSREKTRQKLFENGYKNVGCVTSKILSTLYKNDIYITKSISHLYPKIYKSS